MNPNAPPATRRREMTVTPRRDPGAERSISPAASAKAQIIELPALGRLMFASAFASDNPPPGLTLVFSGTVSWQDPEWQFILN